MLLMFLLALLNDHLIGKELFIPYTVHVFCEHLSIFVCVLLSFWFSGWAVGYDCINS